MKIVSTSYNKVFDHHDPQAWLQRISFYTGILEQLAIHHEVISIDQINYKGSLQQNRVTYYFAVQHRKTALFPFKKHRFIRNLQPDVVLVNGLIYPLQVIQLRIALGEKPKIIVLHRAERPYKHWKKWLQKQADKNIDGYLFTSKEFGNEWNKAGIIDNGKKIFEVIQASSSFKLLDKQSSRSRLGITGEPVFLSVGRLNANKDPLTVVKAFIEFLSFRPNAFLYMIYQDNELLEEVRELIDVANQSENIKLVGKVDHQQMQDWYSSADFIIAGSHYEGSGIAVSEAMSCGCIPIVTKIKSFRAMTAEGECGLLYAPGDGRALLAALIKTLEMNICNERNKTIHQFQKELSFEAIARKIEHIVTTI